MPRPGYDPEEYGGLDLEQTAWPQLDPELRRELQSRIERGALTAAHGQSLYRLLSQAPEERDPESFTALLEHAERLSADAFADWVSERLLLWRDVW